MDVNGMEINDGAKQTIRPFGKAKGSSARLRAALTSGVGGVRVDEVEGGRSLRSGTGRGAVGGA